MTHRIIADIANFIFIDDPPRRADIMLLPGGSDPAIPERAAQLYHEGYASLLLPSGGVSVKSGKFAGVKRKREIYDGDYPSDCAFYVDVLRKCGVPDSAIIQEDKSGFTLENARFSRALTDKLGLRIESAMIVCKNFHARRCLMIYQMAFPEAELAVVPVEVYGITRENWYSFDYGIDRVMGELARCGNQFVGDFKEYLSTQL